MDSIAPSADDPSAIVQELAALPPPLRHEDDFPRPRRSDSPSAQESKEAQSPSQHSSPPVPSPPRLPHRHFEGRSYVDAPPVPFFFHPPPLASSPGTTRSPASHNRRTSLSISMAAGNVPTQHHIAQLSALPAHERASSIFHSLFWHHLPSLISPRPIRRSFIRTTDTVIRATLAFVVAAVVAVQPWSTDVLAIPYLFAMFTAGTVRPTVGSTIYYIDTQGKGVLSAAVIDIIITAAQIQRLSSTPRIVVSEVLLFLTSTLLAYYFHPPLSRRFSLACHALILVLIANGTTAIYLPFQVFLCFCLSYLVSFFLVLIPFPRLARDELLDRYQQSLAVLSTVFVEITASYLNTEPIAPVVWSVTAQSQLDAVSKSLTEMRRLAGETEYESDVFFWLFPKSISVACPINADVDKVEQLYWICTNLLHTLSILKFSTAHAAFVHFLRDSLTSLANEQQSFFRMMSDEHTHRVTAERLADHKRRIDRCMQDAWRDYGIAREHVYGSKEDSSAKPEAAPSVRYQARRRLSLSRAGAIRTVSPHTYSPTEGVTEAVEDALLSGAVIHPSSTSLYHTTTDVFVRSCFFFYVTRYHHALQTIELKQPNPHSAATPAAPSSPSSSAAHKHHKYDAIRTSFIDHMRHPWSWSLVGFHPLRDFVHLVTLMWSFVRRPRLDLVWLRASVKIALIICTAALIAIIPYTNTSSVFPNSIWAAFTAALLTSDTEGALWQRSIHRLLGTLVGGLIGYLIILAFPNGYWYGSIPLLTVWCVPMLYVQESTTFSYLGSLAQLTPIVIVFGYTLTAVGSELTPERYALARMEEICIGVCIALGISTLLWPVSSVRLLRGEMVVSIESFKVGIMRTINVYEEMACRQERRIRERAAKRHRHSSLLHTGSSHLLNIGSSSSADGLTNGDDVKAADSSVLDISDEPLTGREVSQQIEREIAEQNAALQALFSTANSVQLSLARQYRLLADAASEPTFFFSPMPTAQYALITRTERRIWCLILTIEPALEMILEQHKRALEDDGRGGYGRLGELEEEEAMFDVSAIRSDIQLMSTEMSTLLTSSATQLQSGQTEQSQKLEAVVCIVQAVEAAFATSMNEMAARVREGQGRLLRSQQIVPISVFLYSAAQLAEQVLVLDTAIRRLLEVEQPTTYDD